MTKPWLQRQPADPTNRGASVDGTVWKDKGDLARQQRRLELIAWLRANRQIFAEKRP